MRQYGEERVLSLVGLPQRSLARFRSVMSTDAPTYPTNTSFSMRGVASDRIQRQSPSDRLKRNSARNIERERNASTYEPRYRSRSCSCTKRDHSNPRTSTSLAKSDEIKIGAIHELAPLKSIHPQQNG